MPRGGARDVEGGEVWVAIRSESDHWNSLIGDVALSYFVGNVVNPGRIFGATSAVEVLENGTVVQTSTNSMGTGTRMQVSEQFSTSFMASSWSTTIEFLNEDPPTDNTNGLDNVVLAPGTTSTVPESSTLTTFAPGICAFGLLGLWRVTPGRAMAD